MELPFFAYMSMGFLIAFVALPVLGSLFFHSVWWSQNDASKIGQLGGDNRCFLPALQSGCGKTISNLSQLPR